jgi:hypothetical protein
MVEAHEIRSSRRSKLAFDKAKEIGRSQHRCPVGKLFILATSGAIPGVIFQGMKLSWI